MATLLEKGILAAKQGNRLEARTLFEQVLQADDKNDRAWLWMSEVVDTADDRVTCVEKALECNPQNNAARLALDKLRAEQMQVAALYAPQPQLPQPEPSSQSGPTTNGSGLTLAPPVIDPERKPFKLESPPLPAATPTDTTVHHQNTIAMPAVAPSAISNDELLAQLRQQSQQQPAPQPAKKAEPISLEKIPLVPAIIFGTLLVTAIGGIFMLLVMMLFF